MRRPYRSVAGIAIEDRASVTKRMILALLAIVGLLLSAYLTLFKLGYIGHLACSAGTCERVQTSRWSVFLGMPVAAWGVAYYVTLLCVTVAGTQPGLAEDQRVSWLLLALTGWGVLFSAYLTGLELFVIHAICEYCVTSAVVVTIMCVLSAMDLAGLKRGTA